MTVDVEALRQVRDEALAAFDRDNGPRIPSEESAASRAWRRENAGLKAVADLAAAYANGRALGLEKLADRERDARIEERCQLTGRAERAEAEVERLRGTSAEWERLYREACADVDDTDTGLHREVERLRAALEFVADQAGDRDDARCHAQKALAESIRLRCDATLGPLVRRHDEAVAEAKAVLEGGEAE